LSSVVQVSTRSMMYDVGLCVGYLCQALWWLKNFVHKKTRTSVRRKKNHFVGNYHN